MGMETTSPGSRPVNGAAPSQAKTGSDTVLEDVPVTVTDDKLITGSQECFDKEHPVVRRPQCPREAFTVPGEKIEGEAGFQGAGKTPRPSRRYGPGEGTGRTSCIPAIITPPHRAARVSPSSQLSAQAQRFESAFGQPLQFVQSLENCLRIPARP